MCKYNDSIPIATIYGDLIRVLVFADNARYLTVHFHDTRDLQFDRSFGIFSHVLVFSSIQKSIESKLGMHIYSSCNVKPINDMLHKDI